MPIAPDRRAFLAVSATATAALALAPAARAGQPTKRDRSDKAATPITEPLKLLNSDGLAVLPPLPFAADALIPHIDSTTMEIHHDRHHRAYVDNYNAALEREPSLKGRRIEHVLADLDSVPKAVRRAVRNNGGGHYNHTLFWAVLDPADKPGTTPTGELAEAIDASFGSFDAFKEAFGTAAKDVFGSGWAWLVRKPGQDRGKLEITSTANQDSPAAEGDFPVLGLDVWEHAYYLKHQNKRADYIAAFWNVVNWRVADERFRA